MAAICAMVVLAAAGTTAAIATTSATSTGVTITGTISDASGYPLAGIKIEMFADGADEGTHVGTTTTNDAGRYVFSGVEAEAGDPFWFGATDSSGAHVYTYAGFTIGTGTRTTKNRTMPIAGFIQGKVSTKDGSAPAQPAKHAFVGAEGEDWGSDAHVSAKGKFRIGGLPTGKYTLTFLDPDFADQCYSNIRAPFHGSCRTQVTVTAGRTTTITPQVFTHPNSTLSGTVTDTNGKPLEGIQVDAYTDKNRPINLDDPTTKADGSWTVDDIDWAGKIRIVARTHDGIPYRTTWYKSAVDFAHATPVTVTDGSEIGNLRIVMLAK